MSTAVAFFGFNRPQHTRAALEALAANDVPPDMPIHLFCDGPRADETAPGIASIEAVRAELRNFVWPGVKHLEFRAKNAGLAKALVSGISQMFEQYEQVIFIEDDIIVSPGFIRFMLETLKLYRDTPQVMHISGYSPLNDASSCESTTFFFNHTLVWGWASWRRAWRQLSTDGKALRAEVDRLRIRSYLNLDDTFDIYWALKFLDEGRSQDWNCYWHASVIIANGLCLCPVQSLTANTGFDGSGAQCDVDDDRASHKIANDVAAERIDLKEDRRLREIILHSSWKRRGLMKAKHVIRKVLYDYLQVRSVRVRWK